MVAEPRSCPFCASQRLLPGRPEGKFLFAAKCLDCGAQGPVESTYERARERWDRRDGEAITLKREAEAVRDEMNEALDDGEVSLDLDGLFKALKAALKVIKTNADRLDAALKGDTK